MGISSDRLAFVIPRVLVGLAVGLFILIAGRGPYYSLPGGWRTTLGLAAAAQEPGCPPERHEVEGLFDVDLADVKEGNREMARVIAKLKADPALTAVVTVRLKKGGDPIFLETLGKARLEAVDAWLRQRGIKQEQVIGGLDIERDRDVVIVDLVK